MDKILIGLIKGSSPDNALVLSFNGTELRQGELVLGKVNSEEEARELAKLMFVNHDLQMIPLGQEICGAYKEYGFNDGKGCPRMIGHSGNHGPKK